MRTLRICIVVLVCSLSLLLTTRAGAQDGNISLYSDISYDPQTGLVFAEGEADIYTPWAEAITGADWQLTVDLYGPYGYIVSDYDYIYGYDNTMYASVSAYAQEYGYGEYTTDATVSMSGNDFLGFCDCGFQVGDSFLSLLGGSYTPDPEYVGPTDLGMSQASTDAPGPTPTNFAWTEVNHQDGSLWFTYTFQSTSGNPADLGPCSVGETVFYPTSLDPYVWPLPMVQQTRNPTTLYGSGSNTTILDKNLPPNSFRAPYFFADFTAQQRFQWSCPWYNNGQFVPFIPDVPIYRKVFLDTDHLWKYQIKKTHQGAEYVNTIQLP